jgi:hypothetical protein
MGIILIELLISGAMGTAVDPATFPLEAREKVDSQDYDDLSAIVQALAAKGGWTGGDAQRAAKILADVAVACTRGTAKRQIPAQVLGQLEAAHLLVSGGSSAGSGSSGWFS